MQKLHLVALVCLLAAPARAHAPPEEPPKPDADSCAEVTAGVRLEAYGYTHVVTLKNGCDRGVICQVWTDVDKAPKRELRAAPGERDAVITRRGSPARAVSASKECRF